MKKLIYLTLVLGALASCTKGYNESSFNGSGRVSGSQGRVYMLGIANDLVVDNLQVLENALYADLLASGGAVSYETGGKSLRTPGAEWKVKYLDGYKGLSLKCLGEDSWTLRYEGDYLLGSNTYPTRYTLTARSAVKEKENHYDWDVTLDGYRTEKGGYSCHFWTDSPLRYQSDGEIRGWSNCFGVLMMTVYKDGQGIDGTMLELNGPLSSANFHQGVL